MKIKKVDLKIKNKRARCTLVWVESREKTASEQQNDDEKLHIWAKK